MQSLNVCVCLENMAEDCLSQQRHADSRGEEFALLCVLINFLILCSLVFSLSHCRVKQRTFAVVN